MKNNKIALFFALIITLVFVFFPAGAAASGAVINVPGDYPTIQAAIDHASTGDIVQVAAGTYYEKITLKDGVCVSGAGAGATIIDGGGTGTVVNAASVGTNTVFEGFTVQNGFALGITGSAINVSFASPIIRNNIIRNNQGWAINLGGASTPQVKDNTISNNRGGIIIWASQPTITGNIITANGPWGYYGEGCGITTANTITFVIANNIITNNTVDGIQMLLPYPYGAGDAHVVNNTISGNSGAGVNSNKSVVLTLINNIITNNLTNGIYFGDSYNWGNPNSDYNDVWNNAPANYGGIAAAGTHDICADPRFASSVGADYHLQSDSPCIDIGDNSAVPSWLTTDLYGKNRFTDGNRDGSVVVDMGADESPRPNHPPAFSTIGSKSINEGQLLTFTISATDSDNDPLTYSASDLPFGATFNRTTQNFNWTPNFSQAGDYPITFTVSDGLLTDTETISIEVNNVSIQANVMIDPDSIQLAKAGQWITAYIELPVGKDPNNINLASVRLNNTVHAVSDPKYDFVSKPKVYITDIDHDKIPERMVRFDLNIVKDLLYPDNNVLTVTGQLTGWPNVPDFSGSDTIKVVGYVQIDVNPGGSIQAAVDRANPGDVVFVHAGVYQQSVFIGSKVKRILLRGEPGTILDGSSLTEVTEMIAIDDGAQNIVVQGLQIQNFKGPAIQIRVATNNSIMNNKILNCSSGVENWGTNNRIIGNEITDSESPIWLGGANGNIITANVVSTCLNDGIYVGGSSNNLVSQNTISNAGGCGIFLGWESNNNVISENTISNSGNNGIMLHEASNNNELTGNSINGSSNGSGIIVQSSNNAIIKWNTIKNSSQRGISLKGGSNENFVQSNTVSNSGWEGIQVSGDNNIIENNVVSESDRGIAVYDSNYVSVMSNHVSTSTGYDLFWDTNGTGNTWTNNVFTTCDPNPLPS